MAVHWSTEANYYQRTKKDQGTLPYREIRLWKRRFWLLFLLDLGVGVVVLLWLRSWR